MDRKRALEILGLREDATKEIIVKDTMSCLRSLDTQTPKTWVIPEKS